MRLLLLSAALALCLAHCAWAEADAEANAEANAAADPDVDYDTTTRRTKRTKEKLTHISELPSEERRKHAKETWDEYAKTRDAEKKTGTRSSRRQARGKHRTDDDEEESPRPKPKHRRVHHREEPEVVERDARRQHGQQTKHHVDYSDDYVFDYGGWGGFNPYYYHHLAQQLHAQHAHALRGLADPNAAAEGHEEEVVEVGAVDEEGDLNLVRPAARGFRTLEDKKKKPGPLDKAKDLAGKAVKAGGNLVNKGVKAVEQVVDTVTGSKAKKGAKKGAEAAPAK